MAILAGYEYDIFISYRHNDNRSGWVTEFVKNLQEELATTIKDPVSVYYDSNPHDGLLETHNVDKSLEGKLRCLIFIPILSRTYCDSTSFAWQHEFIAFRNLAKDDGLGLDIQLANGNVSSRILPIQIHDLNPEDQTLFEHELGRVLRSISFIFNSKGVNRPLTLLDSRIDNTNHTLYRDQINKVANALEEMIRALQHPKAFPLKKEIRTHDETSPIRPTKSLWNELNRRNVLRAAFVYTIAAIAAQQIATSLPSLFYLPDFSSTITWFLIILFPVAMIMAWLYEISPHGIIRTTSKQAAQNPYLPYQKKPLTGGLTVTFLILLALSLLYYNRSTLDPRRDKSIALMPFINLSGDEQQEYFNVGMMQELINQLVKIRDLNVVSLQSSMNYRDSKKSFKTIASELHVANILEGTVQRSGDRVRIAVRLIDASQDKNIWSQIFVRDISDVFSIQADVSQNIAKELQAVLSLEDEERLRVIPTTNREAYDFYLKSLHYERIDDWIKGIKMCDKALELDPKFTLAYVLRSRWNGTHYFNKWVTWEGRDKLAKADMLKAVELNPDLAEVKICKAYTLYYTERNYEAATQILKELQKDRPNDTQVYYWLGLIQRRQGLWWDALHNMEYAVSKDPGNTEFLIQTAYLHMVLHNYTEAIEYSNKALAINPDIGTARLIIYNSLLAWKGDIHEANKTIVHSPRNNQLESISDSMRMEWARHYYNRQFGKLLTQIDQSKDDIFEDQNYFEPRSLRYAQIHYLNDDQALSRKYALQAIPLLKEKIKNTESDYRIYTALGFAYAYTGDFDSAVEFAKKATEIMPLSMDLFSDGLTSEQSLATTYILVGKYDLAMDILEKLLSIPGNISVQILKLDPIYDKLRSSPRFEKITQTDYKVKY